jgi:hypothetical protein
MQTAEPIHNASSTHPVVIASRVLISKIITRPCYARSQVAPESFWATPGAELLLPGIASEN